MNLNTYHVEVSDRQMTDRFLISVDFVVKAESLEEAEDRIHSLVDEGIIALIDKYDATVESYDITDSNPAEVDF